MTEITIGYGSKAQTYQLTPNQAVQICDLLDSFGNVTTISYKAITPAAIEAAVLKHSFIDSFRVENRKREIVLARQIYSYLCNKLCHIEYGAIAKDLGQNRTSPIHSLKCISDLIDSGNTQVVNLITNVKIDLMGS